VSSARGQTRFPGRPPGQNVRSAHDEGRECGGYLVGFDDGHEFVVEAIYAADGADPRGERDRVVLDRDWFDVVEARARSYGHRVIGDVHTHTHSEARLSPTDERGLRGAADHLQRHWVGIVAARDPGRLGWGANDNLWLRPELNAYIARPGEREVRPILLTVEGRG
jgi:proteasome lid subunit RPN8/RPN11